MNAEHMGKRVRIKCGRCRTVNIAADVPVEMARRRR
jgi:phage FluMu protein Com